MDIRKRWVAVGTAAVLGVGATGATALALEDRQPLPAGSAVDVTPPSGDDTAPATGPVDASPESADSPNASAVDSAASAADLDQDSSPDTTADSPA